MVKIVGPIRPILIREFFFTILRKISFNAKRTYKRTTVSYYTLTNQAVTLSRTKSVYLKLSYLVVLENVSPSRFMCSFL